MFTLVFEKCMNLRLILPQVTNFPTTGAEHEAMQNRQ